MMNQQIDLLKSILFAEWTTLVTFGICLLVLQKQKKPAYQLYTRARQLLAINFLIFAMEPFLYWLKEEEIYSIPYPETISLSLYLIVTVLLSIIYMFLSFTNYMFNANFVVLNITLPQKNVRLDKGTIEKLQRCTLRWQKTPAALTKNITINDVSRQLGTNRTYLSLYLNTYLNLTFSEWIGQIRLKQAKTLLASNAIMSMEQVAEATGFTSSSAFSHYFKAHEGLSPIRWRRQTRHKKTDQSD